MNEIEKARLQMKRNAMPMQQHWHIKRGLKIGTESFFRPWVLLTQAFCDATKAVADALQKRVFFSEASK